MSQDIWEELAKALVAADVGVRGVAEAHDELEGIFLELTETLSGDES
jgi:hypothetical protein